MMKVLDVAPLHEGLSQTINWLERIGTEMMEIDKTVTGIVALEDALKGEGGQAIRSFYEECHLPLLKFFDTFQQRFITVLKSMNQAIDVLEPDSTGFIREDFLEGEIEQGLRHIEQLTESLTNETNTIMRQVSDIIVLPLLDDSEVQFGVRNAKLKRDKTISKLNEFDAKQTTALTPIEQDLRTMETWIVKLEGLFKRNLAGVQFQKTHWSSVTAETTLQTELAQRLAPIESIPAENTNLVDKPKNVGLEVAGGIGTGLFNVGKDLVVGTKDMIRDIVFHPVDTAASFYQTAIHPIDTAEYVLTAISDSYERDVLNGDANSRAQWFSYAMGTIALTAGTRGISSAPKAGTIALKVNAAKTMAATKNAINKSLLADYLPYSPQHRLSMVDNVPFKAMNGPVVKENLIVKAKVELIGKGIGKGEQVLDKVKTYEQARNKVLDLVGDLGSNSQPYTGTLKSSAGYGQVVGRQSADGKVRWRLDYDPNKGTHINIEDFRYGKGTNARKIAIPFEGNESTFKSLLKHLNR